MTNSAYCKLVLYIIFNYRKNSDCVRQEVQKSCYDVGERVLVAASLRIKHVELLSRWEVDDIRNATYQTYLFLRIILVVSRSSEVDDIWTVSVIVIDSDRTTVSRISISVLFYGGCCLSKYVKEMCGFFPAVLKVDGQRFEVPSQVVSDCFMMIDEIIKTHGHHSA